MGLAEPVNGPEDAPCMPDGIQSFLAGERPRKQRPPHDNMEPDAEATACSLASPMRVEAPPVGHGRGPDQCEYEHEHELVPKPKLEPEPKDLEVLAPHDHESGGGPT